MSTHHLAVKLGVEKDGETVFRRLNASMLGASALDAVKREAVTLFRSEFEDSTDGTLEVATLYYHDDEGDKILILSDKDFFNTVKEYTAAGKTSLKFIAKIARKAAPVVSTTPVPRELPSVPKHILDACAKAGGDLTKRDDNDFTLKCSFGDPAYQVLMEWVATLEDGASPQETTRAATDEANVPSSVATQTGESTPTEAVAPEKSPKNVIEALGDLVSIAAASVEAAVNSDVASSKDFAKKQFRAAKKASKDGLKAVKSATRDSLRAAKQASRCAAQTVVAAVTVPPEAGAESSEPALFIHGRHTCDSCLTTPIVGKRFNAVNLPDYDLCENCYGNYSGTENQFVEAVLERDIPFQERWTRKRAVYAERKCRGVVVVAPVPTEAPAEEPEDPVLQEAIRRSLEDAVKKEPEQEVEHVATEVAESVPADVESVATAVVESEPTEVVESKSPIAISDEQIKGDVLVVETVDTNCDEEEYVIESVKAEPVAESEAEQVAESERDVSYASEAEGSGDIATFVGETLDRMSEAIDSLSEELSNEKIEEDSVDYDDDDDKSGSKIVDGEDDDLDSKESWSIVVEEFEAGDADRDMARAAVAIGSALFNSDVLRSSGVVSTASGASMSGSSSSESSSSSSSSSSYSPSNVSTVPTVVDSMVPSSDGITEFQRNRWAVQLEQLHEMGFTNDALCVAAIESLAAADLGIDSHVSVQHVVDRLMSGW